jgi:hypothetical protein
MKIRIKEAIGKSAPELWGKGIDYAAGEEVEIRIVNFPGKYHPWLPNNQYADWAFWTNGDIDLAIIFLEQEIEALLLTPQERDRLSAAPFDKASFQVEIIDAVSR